MLKTGDWRASFFYIYGMVVVMNMTLSAGNNRHNAPSTWYNSGTFRNTGSQDESRASDFGGTR
jgi:hypothetical protein